MMRLSGLISSGPPVIVCARLRNPPSLPRKKDRRHNQRTIRSYSTLLGTSPSGRNFGGILWPVRMQDSMPLFGSPCDRWVMSRWRRPGWHVLGRREFWHFGRILLEISRESAVFPSQGGTRNYSNESLRRRPSARVLGILRIQPPYAANDAMH